MQDVEIADAKPDPPPCNTKRCLWCLPCYWLTRAFVQITINSMRWNKRSDPQFFYFAFCAIQLIGAALIVTSPIAVKDPRTFETESPKFHRYNMYPFYSPKYFTVSSDITIFGAVLLGWLFFFSLPSFAVTSMALLHSYIWWSLYIGIVWLSSEATVIRKAEIMNTDARLFLLDQPVQLLYGMKNDLARNFNDRDVLQPSSPDSPFSLNAIMVKYDCCGLEGPQDFNSTFSKWTRNYTDLKQKAVVPIACCLSTKFQHLENSTDPAYLFNLTDTACLLRAENIRTKGCFSEIMNKMYLGRDEYGTHGAVFASFYVLGSLFLLVGYLVCAVLSCKYHWLIFHVGGDTKLFCFLHCKCCACCTNIGLCCCGASLRRRFNKVTLYHKTRAEAAESILKSKEMRPGREGLAGGGIYFASKPPSTEDKARHIRRGDGTTMLKATVALGRVKRLPPKGVTEMPEFGADYASRFATNSDQMREYLARINHDSVWLPQDHPEFIVYDASQITNIRPVHY